MERLILTVLFALTTVLAVSQDRYITRTGHIGFFSKAPVENIEAHNHQVNSIFDTNSGSIAFSVLIRGFEFEKALMQEHFNENFMESHKFPKATFTGSILNHEQLKLEEGFKNQVTVQGELTVHGVTKPVTIEGTVEKKGNNIIATSSFPIRVEDYQIKIPSVVRNNIAEIVDVSVAVTLEPVK